MENKTMKEQVMEMMMTKMDELKSELKESKEIYADVMLDDNADYRSMNSRKLKCTNLSSQVDLLQSMIDKVSMMTVEVMLPPMARI